MGCLGTGGNIAFKAAPPVVKPVAGVAPLTGMVRLCGPPSRASHEVTRSARPFIDRWRGSTHYLDPCYPPFVYDHRCRFVCADQTPGSAVPLSMIAGVGSCVRLIAAPIYEGWLDADLIGKSHFSDMSNVETSQSHAQ